MTLPARVSLEAVCDFVLDELADVKSTLQHYAQGPGAGRAQSEAEARIWTLREEGRLRRFVYLASVMVRHELHKAAATTRPDVSPRCALCTHLLQDAHQRFPQDAIGDFLFTCSLGMHVSVETLCQSVVLFSRLMANPAARAHFLGLHSAERFACPACSRPVASCCPRSPLAAPPSPRLDVLRDNDRYGVLGLWQSLDECLGVPAASRGNEEGEKEEGDGECGCQCFQGLAPEQLHSAQRSLFEGLVGQLLACMCLAVKLGEDTPWSNVCWSKLSGFSVADVNALELAAFRFLGSDALVTPVQHAAALRAFCVPRCSAPHLRTVPRTSFAAFVRSDDDDNGANNALSVVSWLPEDGPCPRGDFGAVHPSCQSQANGHKGLGCLAPTAKVRA